MSIFDLQCYYNEYLAEGDGGIDAIISVSAVGTGLSGPAPVASAPVAEVIILDVSGSMDGKKIREARKAAAKAIECLRDGARFAVIGGNHDAHLVYPALGLAESSPATRAEAARAVGGLRAVGGTAIGRWIDAATSLLGDRAGVRHAILLTDGRDESESPGDLAEALSRAAGHFQCDCRGVGAEWDVAELRRISGALLGTVDIIARPDDLVADFEAMMRQAMGKSLADVMMRVWTPQDAKVLFFKQVAPDLQDLTEMRREVDPRTGDYPTGAWGDESRDYHLAVQMNPGLAGDDPMRAARVSAVVDGAVAGKALIEVTWTDDVVLSTRINRQVAHYAGQSELAQAIQDGLEARKNGDLETAVARLGRAVQLATESGNEEKLDQLSRVVDVQDADTGRVRLKSQVEAEDEMTLDTRSTRTARVRR